jgi:hypothetical protein
MNTIQGNGCRITGNMNKVTGQGHTVVGNMNTNDPTMIPLRGPPVACPWNAPRDVPTPYGRVSQQEGLLQQDMQRRYNEDVMAQNAAAPQQPQ